MMNILNDEKARKKYLSLIFTEAGEKTLNKYLQNLVGFYLDENKKYPFKIGIVLGVPSFKWANTIDSKEDLLSRIRAYAQILGLDEISLKKGESFVSLKLKQGDDNGK